MLTPEKLDELERLHTKTTGKVWRACANSHYVGRSARCWIEMSDEDLDALSHDSTGTICNDLGDDPGDDGEGGYDNVNLVAIVAAHNALPELIAMARLLWKYENA